MNYEIAPPPACPVPSEALVLGGQEVRSEPCAASQDRSAAARGGQTVRKQEALLLDALGSKASGPVFGLSGSEGVDW